MNDNTYIKIQRAKRQKAEKQDLSFSNISLVPGDVYDLSFLEELDLSDNRLTTIDEQIANLSNLNYLNLGNNSLKEQPASLCHLTNLKYQNISGNPLDDQYAELEFADPKNLQAILTKVCQKSKGNAKGGGDDLFGGSKKNDGNILTLDDDFWGGELLNNVKGKNNNDDIFDDFDFSNNNKGSNRKKKRDSTDIIGKKAMQTNPNFNKANNHNSSHGNNNQRVQEQTKQLEYERQKNEDLQEQSVNNKKRVSIFSNSVKGTNCTTLSDIDLKDLELGPKFNQGGYSVIQTGTFKHSSVVIKKIFDPVVTDELMEEFENEVEMLAKLRHPNIVLMMGHCLNPPNLLIVFEKLERGSLYEILHKSKEKLDKSYKNRIAIQITEAINYQHHSKICHRDQKSHNVLLDEYYNARLCDFGIARYFDRLNKGPQQFIGTPTYMSPEQLQQKAYDEKVDIFALGTLLWELFSNEVPYDGLEAYDVKTRVIAGDELPKKAGIPEKVFSLIQKCRSNDPNKRPTIFTVYSQIITILKP